MDMVRLLCGTLLALFLMGLSTEEPEAQSEIRKLSMRLLEENGLLDQYAIVSEEFRNKNRLYKPRCRLERVSRILEDPFRLETEVLKLREGIEGRIRASGLEALPEVLAYAADVIDSPVREVQAALAYEDTGFPEDHFAFITDVLDDAASLRSHALSALTEKELDLAFEAVPAILDKFIHHIYLETDSDDQEIRRYREGLRALEKVDLAKMAEAAILLAGLVQPDYLKQVRKDLARYKEKVPAGAKEAGFTGDILVFRQTRHGPIVIGGRRPTRYEGKAAFILDFGGNDTYRFAASTLDRDRGISVVIDLAGKDKYLTTARGSLACGRLGVSLLFDLGGDDRYEGTCMTQGFGGGGVGLLWDEKGKDQYKGEEYAHGGAFFGIGLLVDREGNDAYNAFLYSQGFGLTKGLGVLLDLEGGDRYTATGKYPCTYGMDGVFQAASQGHGTGLRRYKNTSAPVYGGGIGALMDGDGDDQYEAGNFSQGCGYFFGLGILADRSGDDLIRGSRYTQGTGAHQAAGIVINDEGDDRYIATVAANQAGTWDITAGMFLDYRGNDTYSGPGLSQAGTAQTAFALFFDGQGNDTYRASGGASQGGTGSYEYHDKPSFSIFLDVGGGKDSYNRPERKNNKILLEEWYGVFADFKQKTVGHILKSPAGKLKGVWGSKKK